jgi:SNF2 family DNA or RNA helicase
MENKQPLSMHLLTVLLRLRQAACDPTLVVPEEEDQIYPTSGKQEMVLETARTILSEGYKILIFSQFVGHLALMEKRFDDNMMKSFYMDGDTHDRQEVIERFQQWNGPCVFFISIKTGGLGLNLTEANYAFLLDPWWNPAVENQAIDRCYRIGQENPVTVYRFITRNSIEEHVMALKERKGDIQQQIISESDMDRVPLTEEKLIQLLFQ